MKLINNWILNRAEKIKAKMDKQKKRLIKPKMTGGTCVLLLSEDQTTIGVGERYVWLTKNKRRLTANTAALLRLGTNPSEFYENHIRAKIDWIHISFKNDCKHLWQVTDYVVTANYEYSIINK